MVARYNYLLHDNDKGLSQHTQIGWGGITQIACLRQRFTF